MLWYVTVTDPNSGIILLPTTTYSRVSEFVPIVRSILDNAQCPYKKFDIPDVAALQCKTTNHTRRHIEFAKWLTLVKEPYTEEYKLQLKLKRLAVK
jgi:hypothetical protein